MAEVDYSKGVPDLVSDVERAKKDFGTLKELMAEALVAVQRYGVGFSGLEAASDEVGISTPLGPIRCRLGYTFDGNRTDGVAQFSVDLPFEDGVVPGPLLGLQFGWENWVLSNGNDFPSDSNGHAQRSGVKVLVGLLMAEQLRIATQESDLYVFQGDEE